MHRYFDLSSHLAPYACHWRDTFGRYHTEKAWDDAPQDRTPFQRDRDRIIHSRAFRRLQHKTQVFVKPDSDHYRTRLTHSLEVSQIARSIGRVLGLDEDLCEALALAHDLGHPPFGHTGENALDAQLAKYGGFNHNNHTIRIVTDLEDTYPNHCGLNLSWETLEGLVKHNGPINDLPVADRSLERTLGVLKQMNPGFSERHHASLEAQVAAISDEIAYNHHDLEDGLVAGILDLEDLCQELDHVREARCAIRKHGHAISPLIERRQLKRVLIHQTIVNLLEESSKNLCNIDGIDSVRTSPFPIIDFCSDYTHTMKRMKQYLHRRLYKHQTLSEQRICAEKLVNYLFAYYLEHPKEMDEPYRKLAGQGSEESLYHVVRNYTAGMTDNFALLKFKEKIFDNRSSDSEISQVYQSLSH